MSKNIRLIFLYLIFYGLSVGIWSEFAQLWLKTQDITIANIGIIVASASFVAGLIIVLITKYIKKINELAIVKISFLSKMFFLLAMIMGCEFSIKWLSITSYIIDSILNNIIVLITYPLITHLLKNEHIYSKRKLIEYTAKDVGLLVASFLLGKTVGGFVLNYNSMIAISMFFVACATIVVFLIKNCSDFANLSKTNLKKVLKDKIIIIYLIYLFFGQIAYCSALGMQLLLITKYANFTPSTGALFFVGCGVLGDIFGYIALKKLTPKNDYLTISIKFGFRFMFYTIIVIVPIKEVLLIGLFVSLFFSRAYENKTDGIYINRCDKDNMFAFANFRYAIDYIGKAFGTLICGFVFELGLRYIFGISIAFIAIQMSLCYILIKLRMNEAKKAEAEIKPNLQDDLGDTLQS